MRPCLVWTLGYADTFSGIVHNKFAWATFIASWFTMDYENTSLFWSTPISLRFTVGIAVISFPGFVTKVVDLRTPVLDAIMPYALS